MMRRILACLVAVACLLTAFATFAMAEGTMKVIKCKQSVNLREGPSTDTASLGQVPLGTVLTGCAPVAGSDWYSVNYEGTVGYIRGDFLEAVEEAPAQEAPAEEAPLAEETLIADEGGEEAEAEPEVFVPAAEAPVESINDISDYIDDFTILNEEVNGLLIIARQIFQIDNEYLMVVALDANGNEVWREETNTGDVSELTQTDAFIGGTVAMPLVLMYNDWVGLSALDPATGETRWDIPKAQLFLGGSISHAVGGNGIAYIGGYYGPDPVAIDAGGNVLWQADTGSSDIFWLNGIELESDGIACRYSSVGDENSGTVYFDYNGNLKGVVAD